MAKWRLLSEKQLEEIIQERVEQASKEFAVNYEQELLMKQASLLTLQSQINPHFLYNALECIRGQALLDGADDVAKITQALSHFFRYSISGKSNIVSLGEELDNVDSYIAIQKFRFRDRFIYKLEIEDDEKMLLNAVFPKLTLQPIVENAIIHGFSHKSSGGILKISVKRRDQHISILISDNGIGMDKAVLDRFKENLGRVADLRAERHTGIGMQNVNRRLKLYFGEEYGMSVDSCPDLGTQVELFFPYLFSIREL